MKPTLACTLTLCVCFADACVDDATRTQQAGERSAGAGCMAREQGCECEGNQPPVSCRPEPGANGASGNDDPSLCYEGTRYCRGGVWSGCENVHAFARDADHALQTALIDPDASHPQCSECDPLCFRVIDTLDPADGPLDAAIATGIRYHPSGAGLTLEPLDAGAADGGILPGNGITLLAPEGVPASAQYAGQYRPSAADVYVLVDQSSSMAEETLWLYDAWSTTGPYLSPALPCAFGNQSLLSQGISGALSCMVASPEAGTGFFRDIPFDPYATDTKLPIAQQDPDARAEIAFANLRNLSPILALVKPAIAAFGGVQSSGDPDFAGSQIAALYSLATGAGMITGLGRTSVPAAAACPVGRFGYPCFREASDALVVLVTDAPMHNGPLPSSYPYDYDPAKLATTTGTIVGDVRVPPTNDRVANAYLLSSNTQSMLATFVGTTSGFGGEIPASVAGCSASPGAPDAVFRFDVAAPSGPVPIKLSTDGSAFATTLSVHDGPPPVDEILPPTGDGNERFDTAAAFGDSTGRSVIASGDTTQPSDPNADMRADYQGSLFGAICGANTLAPDAAFSFDVGSSATPVDLSLSLDMGPSHGVLSIYDASSSLPPWPRLTSPILASGNDTAHATPYEIPTGAGNDYLTITGDTRVLSADYDPSALGGSACNPDAAAKDAAFHLQVSGTRTLRFDTEGSSFDTVLSLHSRPPVAISGNVTTHSAASTHQNQNETTSSAYYVGNVIGRAEIYQGDTTGMRADTNDHGACGLDDGCGDAVYSLTIDRRTTLRLSVAGTGFVPGLQITRADPTTFAPHVSTLAAGDAHTCALSGGQAFCWGADGSGQLGNGMAGGGADSSSAVSVSGVSQALELASGLRHSCVALVSGAAQCWGEGTTGQLGDGNMSNALAPVTVQDLGTGSGALGRAIQLAAGDAHTCALLHDGKVACWGDNTRGQLGDGGMVRKLAPTLVAGSTVFAEIAAGGKHTCGIRASDRAVLCWGEGRYGQAGDGSTTVHTLTTPTLVNGLTNVKSLALGGNHTCATLSSGRVMCWGRNVAGQLGVGNTTDSATPLAVKTYDGSALLDNAAGEIAAGLGHTCAQMLEGYVFCWGAGSLGQLGNGSTNGSTRPTGVNTLIDTLDLASYSNHTCVLRRAGDLVCWGDGANRKLGDGGTSTQSQPVAAQPGSGGAKVSFGNGNVDVPFMVACQSQGKPPEAGCTYGAAMSGTSYFFCATQSRTWHSAGMACEDVGMRLLDVDSVGENAYVASHLSGPSWIGAKRASSSDWLDLEDNVDFTNLDDELIWHTDVPYAYSCPLFGPCSTTPTRGHFINDLPTDPAASDLVDSTPWTTASTWSALSEPKPTDVTWGHNCATLDPQGKWTTDACSAVPQPSCGFLGLGCLLGALLGTLVNLVGGLLAWLTFGLIDLRDLVNLGNGGRYSAPHFSGGVEHPYVCEQHDNTRDVTLDPGTYYVVVKGIDDGQATNACTGPYELRIDDIGTPSGGFLSCDDNGVAETTSSVLQTTLTTGDYYLVLKGKRASDAGAYNLTVRDVSAVQTSELACDASGGSGDPAQIAFTAQPGHQYYALVKGDTPIDKGPYTLAIRDLSRITGQRIACDATSGPAASSELTVPLGTGSYYAVLKGRAPGAQGNYRLTVGGAAPTTSAFTPPTYAQTIDALNTRELRVATVLSCNGAPCTQAHAQAQALADDTAGTLRIAPSASDVPQSVVSAVYELESLGSVTGQLRFTPDANPGFVNATALSVPTSLACTDAGDGTTLLQCGPGAQPTYAVELLNPLLTPVPPGPGPQGSYQFTLHLEGERGGEVLYSEDVPVYVVPSGGAAANTYATGSYTQDMDGRGCTRGANLAPSWQELVFDADVRPETQLEFFACTASTQTDLALCPTGAGTASGYARVLTVTADSGVGVACSAATQALVCPDGYCSPYTGICQHLEGASCTSDADCPDAAAGSCHDGPSVATLGKTCLVRNAVANPASALGVGNLQPFLRMRIDLASLGDRSRSPALFSWETRYRCGSVL